MKRDGGLWGYQALSFQKVGLRIVGSAQQHLIFFFNLFVYFNTKQLMTSLYFAISHWLWKTEGFKVAHSCEEGSDSLMI